MKSVGEVEVKLHTFLTFRCMEVNGQLHTPTASVPVLNRRQSELSSKNEISFSVRDSNPFVHSVASHFTYWFTWLI